jgi:hypothetical protein
MVLAGIDFSINSASVCIFSDGEYSWLHFGREASKYFWLGNKNFQQWVLPKRESHKNYCSNERMKMDDAKHLCSNIYLEISKRGVTHVAFEGHSFGSKGNSLLELVSYQFLLRYMLVENKSIELNNMYFYSPMTIKAFAGSGKFNKVQLLEKFIELDDLSVKKNDVHVRISSSIDEVLKKDKVVKPVDDVIDSFWILKKLQSDV